MTTHEIPLGQILDLTTQIVGVHRETRRAALVRQEPGRPPVRIDGVTIGAPLITADAPHDGEIHPDGDELLYLVSGAMNLRLELPDGDVDVDLRAGNAVIVPQGIWHKLVLNEPSQLLHITPGPAGDARALPPLPGGARRAARDRQ